MTAATSTNTITYRIRHARPDDVDACLALRTHAEHWLHAARIEQWTDHAVGERDIKNAIGDGSLFAVTTNAGNDIIGCLALNGPDQDFWAPYECVHPALYLYKLIVRSDRRRTGLGDVLMDWACRRAMEAGARWLRLDCWKTNTKLQDYYLDRGFEHVGTRTAEGRNSGWLGQRDTAVRTADPATLGIMLVDDSDPVRPAALPLDTGDLYDPTGRATILNEAAQLVMGLTTDTPPQSESAFNDGLEQAARVLETRGREQRQRDGMYNRALTGKG